MAINRTTIQQILDTVQELHNLQSIARRIHVEDDLYEYAVGLASYTRTTPPQCGQGVRLASSAAHSRTGWCVAGSRCSRPPATTQGEPLIT